MTKDYQFTLVLKNVDESTENLDDSLYEAGCDDALINFRNGAVYLDFDREAVSLQEAIIQAIKDVESASIEAKVVQVAPENLVTEADVAKRLPTKRQTISLWIQGKRRTENPFPKPIMKLSEKSPLWKWSDITKWLFDNKIISDKKIVEDAVFIENMNMALEERDISVRKYRQGLLKKLDLIPHVH